MVHSGSFEKDHDDEQWPRLSFEEWKDTYATLHMWTQVVGKIKLAQAPWVNHSWHVVLYIDSRGLTTSAVPYGSGTFEIRFDFIDHKLLIHSSSGGTETMPLEPRPVAGFYEELSDRLAGLGVNVKIRTTPNEVADAVPFEKDYEHSSYDARYVNRFWRVLVQADRVFKQFRARYSGKCSPVHFFWGSFDLAVTRFSGRGAPEHPGGVPNLPDWVAREAYSHEVSSCGFWPGSAQVPRALFYSYAYPEPAGFSGAAVRPEGAVYHSELREFILPYDEIRRAASPDQMLLEFLQSTYEAAAKYGGWDRPRLERGGAPRLPSAAAGQAGRNR